MSLLASTIEMKHQYKLQDDISRMIHNDNQSNCYYEWDKVLVDGESAGVHHRLSLVTTNQKHDGVFILHTTTTHPTKIKCLEEIQNFLLNIKKNKDILTYQIRWSDGDATINTSFFYGYSFQEVIEKFFSSPESHGYTIHSANLQPIS